jgi:hypothetical protein
MSVLLAQNYPCAARPVRACFHGRVRSTPPTPSALHQYPQPPPWPCPMLQAPSDACACTARHSQEMKMKTETGTKTKTKMIPSRAGLGARLPANTLLPQPAAWPGSLQWVGQQMTQPARRPSPVARRPSPPPTNLRECTPSDKSPSHSHPYPARVTNVRAARPPFPACGGLIGHAPPNYHVLPARPARIARRVPSHAPMPPCSHAPMHPCTRAARAIRQQPAAQPPNTRPALVPSWILCPSLSILPHSMTNYPISHVHHRHSRTLPVSSRAAVSPPAIGPAAVLFASQARNVSAPSCALAFMPGPRPASRDRLRLPHTIARHPSLVTRWSLAVHRDRRSPPRCTLHAAPSPLCPQTQNTTKHPRALLDSPPQLHQHSQKAPLPYRPSTRPTAYLPHDPRSPILARPARPLLALPCRDATPAARPPPRRRPTPARFLASSCNPLTCP